MGKGVREGERARGTHGNIENKKNNKTIQYTKPEGTQIHHEATYTCNLLMSCPNEAN